MKTTINAKQIRSEMQKRRRDAKYLTLKAIRIISDCFDSENYTPAHQLSIYTKHSGLYCELLEVLAAHREAVIR